MTTALIPLTTARIGDGEITAVTARDLHTFLAVGKDFSTWFRDRVMQFEFVMGEDFIILPGTGENQSGRPRTEYAVSLDMAKELAMVERNAKGKAARRYFIECERRALAGISPMPPAPPAPAFQLPQSFAEALQLAADQARRLEAQEAALAAAAPKIEAFDQLMATEGLLGLQAAGKALGCGPQKFVDWLKADYLFYQGKPKGLVPYAKHVEAGLFVVRATRLDEHPPVVDEHGREVEAARPAMVVPRTFVTPAGLDYFRTRVPEGIRLEKAA